jgi:hypothetical protein
MQRTSHKTDSRRQTRLVEWPYTKRGWEGVSLVRSTRSLVRPSISPHKEPGPASIGVSGRFVEAFFVFLSCFVSAIDTLTSRSSKTLEPTIEPTSEPTPEPTTEPTHLNQQTSIETHPRLWNCNLRCRPPIYDHLSDMADLPSDNKKTTDDHHRVLRRAPSIYTKKRLRRNGGCRTCRWWREKRIPRTLEKSKCLVVYSSGVKYDDSGP